MLLLLMLWHMARASRSKLEDVNKNALVGVAGVEGQHPVVDVLLGALGLVAGGKESASRIGKEAGLEPSGLRELQHPVDHDPPFAIDVASALGHGVDDL